MVACSCSQNTTSDGKAALDAIAKAWSLTVKARALCPYTDESAIWMKGYLSPDWYRQRGAIYFVNLAEPLSSNDVRELNLIGTFIDRSLVISMAAILETHGILPYRSSPDRNRPGGDHVQLTKWLRHQFAHGEWEYDPNDKEHLKTMKLLRALFPATAKTEASFVIPINEILEPLKDGVLDYMRAS